MLQGPRVPFPFIQFRQPLLQCLSAHNLHFEVQGGVNLQPSAIKEIFTVFFKQIAPHMLSEIGCPLKSVRIGVRKLQDLPGAPDPARLQ